MDLVQLSTLWMGYFANNTVGIYGGTAMGIKWAIKWDVQLYNQQYMDFMDSMVTPPS